MREPYASLDVLPFRLKTFLSMDVYTGLMTLLSENTPFRNAIEIGSYYGGSARTIGDICKLRGGVLTCVDPWVPWNQILDQSIDEPSLFYEQFLSNVIHWGLADTISPMRMTSLEAAAIYDGPKADLIYIDAYHTYDALKADMLAWWPHLKEGGVMCGDDFVWKDIPRAIGDACHEIGATPTPTHGTFWKLKPKARETCLTT